MKKYINKILVMLSFTLIFLIALTVKSNATVSLSVTPSVGEVEPEKTFNVTVRVSGGAGYVNLSATNATISSSSIWLDNGSKVISCVAGSNNGSTITISASATIGDYETETDVDKTSRASVKINKKQEVPATPSQPTEPKNPATGTNKNNSNTKNTNKSNTNLTKTETTETTETTMDEDNFYINTLKLIGIKENGEKEEIIFTPEFNKDIYEYTANINAEIKKIEIEKDAGDYTNSIIINNPDELLEGENVISLMLSAEDHEAKTYTIKVNKENKEKETAETMSDAIDISKQENISKAKAMINMPVISFIILQIIIIMVEILVIYIIFKKAYKNR